MPILKNKQATRIKKNPQLKLNVEPNIENVKSTETLEKHLGILVSEFISVQLEHS